MDALWVAKGSRFLQEENFDGGSMGSQGSQHFFSRKTLMSALWVAKGPRFLQEEYFDGCSTGTQGFKVSS